MHATTHVADGHDRGVFGRFDWSAILASVFAGLGITILLITLGGAIGIEAGDDKGNDNGGLISSAVGTWAVISALIGTLVGTFIGGRYSRWRTTGSAIYHAVVSWGVVTVASILLASGGVMGLLGSAMQNDVAAQQGQQQAQAQAPQGEAAAANQVEQATDAISWGGWALAAGMLLTLLVAIAGWWFGSRSKLAGFEAPDATTVGTNHVVHDPVGRRVTN